MVRTCVVCRDRKLQSHELGECLVVPRSAVEDVQGVGGLVVDRIEVAFLVFPVQLLAVVQVTDLQKD